MVVLYYGNGECTIESGGVDIRGVQLGYEGYGLKLKQTTSDSFYIVSNDKRIIIFPIGYGFLDNLFVYSGKMKITSILAVDNDGIKVPCKIKRVMDYADMIYTNAEDMTTLSEDVNVGYKSVKQFAPIKSNRTIIENLNTKEGYYLSDGSCYMGSYHIHLKDSAAMTGATHTSKSQDLYIKQAEASGLIVNNLIPTRNPSHRPSAEKFGQRKKRGKRRN